MAGFSIYDAGMTAILIIDAHPDPRPSLCHAIAAAYVEGARDAGYDTRLVRLADADIPLLRRSADFMTAPDAPAIVSARDDVVWATHIVFVFPLWLGGAPALLHAFLEQIARGGFLAEMGPAGPKGRLHGKSARMIVTMGMPDVLYRLAFGAFGVRALARSVLGFAGVAPVRGSLFGPAEAKPEVQSKRLAQARALGSACG